MTNQLKPGEYFIGDLSYVLADKDWQSLIGKTDEGFFEMKGVRGFFDSTDCGDGSYEDQQGYEYPVDTGTIGVIPIAVCGKAKLKEAIKNKAGRTVQFQSPFTPERDSRGTFTFSFITIITDGSDEEEERDGNYCPHCERSCGC